MGNILRDLKEVYVEKRNKWLLKHKSGWNSYVNGRQQNSQDSDEQITLHTKS